MGKMNISPWDSPNAGGNLSGGNTRQGGGEQRMNAQSINLANNLLNNLFRNQHAPSLLDLSRGGGVGMGNRNQRGGPMVNRGGPGNRPNNRRIPVGFKNRGTAGFKSAPKQGAGGIRSKQNALDRAKQRLAKNANNKKKDSATTDKENESRESPYATVANDVFYCHLCKKHMWDTNSFENHIKGRTHLMMREGIEESYSLKANMIRQEAKIAEQLKTIELDRLKRMGKTKQRQLEYCTMCDLNFHGYISEHRKSECHLQLKKFLHPKCVGCNKEFANRIDYDTHLLSVEHLQKAAENNTKVGERKRNTLTILTEEEELKDVRPPQKRRKKPVPQKLAEGAEVKKEGENAEAKKEKKEAADETKEGGELNEIQEEEEVELPVDPDDCILDYSDGDKIPTEVNNRLPKYNWTRPVGTGLIAQLECFKCSLCSKFFDTDKTVEVHSRTVTHHRNFLKFINEKSSDTKVAKKRAAAVLEESERKKRKLEEVETAAAGETAVTVENGNAEGGEEKLYDPSETTSDDGEEGDFEMVDDQDDGEDGEGDEGGEDEDMKAQDDGEQDGVGDQDQETEPEPVKEQPKPAFVQTPAKSAQNTQASTPVPPLITNKNATPARAAPKASPCHVIADVDATIIIK